MRRNNPVIRGVTKRVNPLRRHDQAYDTLILPSTGTLAWTAFNQVLAVYQVSVVGSAFACISWPATTLPLFVRYNGIRYRLNAAASAGPVCFSVPYKGQTLGMSALFEIWSAGTVSGSATIPDLEITISKRTQLCCDETEGTEHRATPYSLVYRKFPICFPICL